MNDSLKSEHGARLWIKDITADDPVRGLYLVKMKKVGMTRKGSPFLSITLADRTGEMAARVWEGAEAFSPLFSEGDVIDVEGYAGSYRNEIQVTVTRLRAAEDDADPALFLEATTRDVSEMMRSLRDILKEIGNPHVKALVERFLSDRRFISLFKRAPAAKNFHHAYLGGLLEHTLSVCQVTRVVTHHYKDLDRDLLLAGAFLHDIGKVRELSFDRFFDYTGEGRLLGHLMLGTAMVDEKLAGLKGFPLDLALRLKHLILSHHGEYEFGSPKRPKFLEAFALHLIDDLDAKMNGLARFMERDRQEGAWTDFNRLFDRFFLKGRISSLEEEVDPVPPGDERQKALFST
jgi:3'-5' exoribonuclease